MLNKTQKTIITLVIFWYPCVISIYLIKYCNSKVFKLFSTNKTSCNNTFGVVVLYIYIIYYLFFFFSSLFPSYSLFSLFFSFFLFFFFFSSSFSLFFSFFFFL